MPLTTPVTPTDFALAHRRRFGLLLWMAGFVGVLVVTATVLARLQGYLPLPAPLWAIYLAGVAQSAVVLALAVWAGVALGPAVSLRAPAFEAGARRHPIAPALRPQLPSGITGGVLGGMLLFIVGRNSPAAFAEAQELLAAPLPARVLYGGITEELLMRWGLLTALAWLMWRFLQQRRGPVNSGFVWLAIAVSAVLFGAGHLPIAYTLLGQLDTVMVAFVVCWNTAFGVLFGYLFWRYGLESAMIAHALTHVVSYLANLPLRGAA